MKKMSADSNVRAFFALLRAGLWGRGVCLLPCGDFDYGEVFRIAEEQSVSGLAAAGLGYVLDAVPPEDAQRRFLERAASIRARNNSLDEMLRFLVQRLREERVHAVLVKGQGVAQTYERPDLRTAGDIDFFFDSAGYERAKAVLAPLSQAAQAEGRHAKHLALFLASVEIELHGRMRTGLSSRVDAVIDDVQDEIFSRGAVRYWDCGGVEVSLPSPDNDAVIIFTHFLKHFYKGGIGLRQICDWVRLLWTYRDKISRRLLTVRLQDMGLESEWKAFAAYAVEYLGMPASDMPLYDASGRWRRKAGRIHAFILEVGNFGRNRDMDYYAKYPYLVRKAVSMGRRVADLVRHALIFPLDSLRFFPRIMLDGIRSAARGE